MANIFHTFYTTATPDEVYDTFCTPLHLNNWWTLESEGTPQVNEIYRLYFGEPYDWRVKVTIALRGKQFEWKVLDADQDWNPTRFGIEISALTNKTKIDFYHLDWPEGNDHYKHSSYCWALLLHGMKRYMEANDIIPFVQRA